MLRTLLFLTVLMILLLPACAQSVPAVQPTSALPPEPTVAQSQANSSQPVTITFWHGQAGPLGKVLDKRIQDFQAAHPNIQVQAEFIGGWGELNQKIMASAVGKGLPAVAQVGVPSFTGNYAKEGLIKPIQEFVDSDPEATKLVADIYPGFVEENTYAEDGQSKLLSWPFGKAVTVAYYNQDLLEAAGLQGPAKTWQEFFDQAAALKKAGAAAEWAWTPEVGRVFTALLRSNGSDLINLDCTKVRFDEPAAVASLEMLAKQVKNNDLLITKGFDGQNELINGKSVYYPTTIVSRQYIEPSIKNFKLGTAPLPAGSAGQSTELYGPNAVIFSTATPEQQQAAWTFLKWWASKENQIPWSVQSGYVPFSKSVAESTEFQDASQANPSLAVGAQELPNARPGPNCAVWAEIEPLLLNAINSVLLGQADAATALKDAASTANSKLAK